MEPVVIPVHDGGDTADHLPVPARQKKLGIGVRIERMLFAIQQFLDRDPQLGHPIGVVAINCVRHFHEGVQRLLVVYRNDLNISQS